MKKKKQKSIKQQKKEINNLIKKLKREFNQMEKLIKKMKPITTEFEYGAQK